MIRLKTIYGEALFRFPMNKNSIFTITDERDKSDYFRYGSLIWNTDYLITLLSCQVPKAVNLLFIPESYWIFEKDDVNTDMSLWTKLKEMKKEFITEHYAEVYNNILTMQIDRYIRNKETTKYTDILDLVKLLFNIETGCAILNYGEIKYPMDGLLNSLSLMYDKNVLISRIIGRHIHFSYLTSNKMKGIAIENKVLKKLISFKKGVSSYDG